MGLGPVWTCYFKPDVIRQEFRLPDTLKPINILAIGYADKSPAGPQRQVTQRVPLNGLVQYESYKGWLQTGKHDNIQKEDA